MSLVHSRGAFSQRGARHSWARRAIFAGFLVLGATVFTNARGEAAAPPTSCAASQVRVTLVTGNATYRVGQVVTMRATLQNVSSSTCTISVGGTTPTFSVYDATGVPVWSYCSSLVQPEMCAQYLRLVTLAPKHCLVTTASWPTSGTTSVAPVGVYRLVWRLLGTSISANTSFALESSVSAPLVLTETDSGKSVVLRVGQRLILRLGASIDVWRRAGKLNTSVLWPLDEASSTTSSPTFLASSPGRVVLTLTGTPRCYPQCLLASRVFRVGVRVV